ncbi:MAG: quinolinate synthase NadA [Lentisphaerae bacterium]|nr:quinolinate synthase NadA [Lentisphaerota bacterium]
MDIIQEIAELKAARNAVIMAHNYTLPEVQDIADFSGDSLELARIAADCQAKVIVLCGVRFMAETAKILSPDSIVLHPAPESGCPMADMADPADVRKFRENNPDTLLIAYVNTTAATKSEVDICCTSGNAEKIVASLPAGQKVMFLPDANLGGNLVKKLDRPMELWNGCCPIHNRITPDDIRQARQDHPGAVVMVHPECRVEVTALADEALSTGGMLKFVADSPASEFVVGTEIGIIHRMKKENPDKKFYPLENNPVCEDMKKITLDKIASVLRDLSCQVQLDEWAIAKARKPIEKMLELSK